MPLIKKKQQKYSFCQKRKKIFFAETKRCSAKMLVGKVVPQKITKELAFVNRNTV